MAEAQTKVAPHTEQRPDQQRRGGRPDRRQRPQEVEEKQFDERTLHIDRVARVVKGGRRFRFRALVVVGDRKTRVGVGIAKGADVTAAVTKATDVAKKSMLTVSLYKGTLPHESSARVGGANIFIKPASAGTGLIAGGVVRTILEVAGISNVLSKSLGSTNKANTAYATIEALRKLQPAKDWVTASARKADARQATKTASQKVAAAKPAAAKAETADKPAKADKPASKPAAKKVAKQEAKQ